MRGFMKLKYLFLLVLSFTATQVHSLESCVVKEGVGEIKVVEKNGTEYSIGAGNYLLINKKDSWSYHVEVYSKNGQFVAAGQTSIQYADPSCEKVNPFEIVQSINGSHFYKKITKSLPPENCPPPSTEVPNTRPKVRPPEPVVSLPVTDLNKQVGALIAKAPFNKRCNQLFINTKGEVGVAGQEIIKAVQNHASQCLYNDLDVSSICPKYKNFSTAQKDSFWVYAFASVAQFESSCNPTADAAGTNDVADGLFQMEYSWKQRRSAGRDRKLCKASGPYDSQDIKFQAECSISILRDTNCKFGWPLDGRKGYWHLLRSNSSFKIGKTMMNFPGCK
jgi:hypothetical protein